MRQFLKYEIKRELKNILFACGLIILSFVLLSVYILIIKNIKDPSAIVYVIYSNVLLLIGGALIVSVVLFIISVVKSLYTNLFTDEGYLTLSIPKSLDSLLIAKFITYFCWIIMYMISFVIGIFLISLNLGSPTNDVFLEISLVLEMIKGLGTTIPFMIINYFFTTLLTIIIIVLTFSFINIGITKKGKVPLGILFYLVFEFLISMLRLAFNGVSFGIGIDGNNNFKFVYGSIYSESFLNSGCISYALDFTNLLITIVLIISGYVLTKYLIKNHLELE